MIRHLHRKWIAFPAIVVGGLMLLAGTAFACTTYLGNLTVTPNGTGSSGSVTADGNGTGMGYCSGPTGTADLKSGNTLGVSVGATTTCPGGSGGQNHLTGGTFTNPVNYPMSIISGTGDCMYVTPNVGTLSLTNSNGTGSATSNTITETAGQYQFCISNSTNMTGNQVPITLV